MSFSRAIPTWRELLEPGAIGPANTPVLLQGGRALPTPRAWRAWQGRLADDLDGVALKVVSDQENVPVVVEERRLRGREIVEAATAGTPTLSTVADMVPRDSSGHPRAIPAEVTPALWAALVGGRGACGAAGAPGGEDPDRIAA